MKSLNKDIIIAVDGYSSCGKSTFARAIAEELNYLYVDSGAMYRAVALYCLRNNIIINGTFELVRIIRALALIDIEFKFNEQSLKYETFLNNENVEEDIRSVEVSEVVSLISKIREVREKILILQRRLGERKGIVMDGRDIGTVVFPEAELKIFMTADVDIRAKRRYDELKEKGLEVSLSEIKKNIEERDHQDVNRKESPLAKADDAVELDNSNMTPAEQMVWFRMIMSRFHK
ncbi:MAG: (d)CMP kinase [Bacteroidales bacterium]|nr:MAG: (d)CMP kinase [Bacteroidales bacterium]